MDGLEDISINFFLASLILVSLFYRAIRLQCTTKYLDLTTRHISLTVHCKFNEKEKIINEVEKISQFKMPLRTLWPHPNSWFDNKMTLIYIFKLSKLMVIKFCFSEVSLNFTCDKFVTYYFRKKRQTFEGFKDLESVTDIGNM